MPVRVTVDKELALGGWALAAVVEPPLPNTEVNILTTSPKFHGLVPMTYRKADPYRCEHCGKHRDRKRTYVCFNEGTGEYRQVGQQCLRDFLGHDPSFIVMAAQFIRSLDELMQGEDEDGEWFGGAYRMRELHSVESVIGRAARVVVRDGYRPRSMESEGNPATATTVSNWTFASKRRERGRPSAFEEYEDRYPVTEKAEAYKARVLSRVSEIAAHNFESLTSDYDRNLWAVCKSGLCEPKHFGLVVSLISWAERAEQREAKAKAEREKWDASKSQHVGKIGERLRDVPAVVTFTKVFEGHYGAKTLVKFLTTDGNLFQWWATGVPDLKAGTVGKVTGTVKAHEADRYSGNVPVTILSRVAFAANNAEELPAG